MWKTAFRKSKVIWSAYADLITSNSLNAAFHKFYLVHSWIPWLLWTFTLCVNDNFMFKVCCNEYEIPTINFRTLLTLQDFFYGSSIDGEVIFSGPTYWEHWERKHTLFWIWQCSPDKGLKILLNEANLGKLISRFKDLSRPLTCQ